MTYILSAEEKKVIDNLALLLKSDNVEIRRGAAIFLDMLRDYAASAIPALAISINDEDFLVRDYSFAILGDMGASAKSAVPSLIKSIEDEKGIYNLDAIIALDKLGKVAETDLILALSSEKIIIRMFAAFVLKIMDLLTTSDLIYALQLHYLNICADAAKALGNIGRKSQDDLPDLIKNIIVVLRNNDYLMDFVIDSLRKKNNSVARNLINALNKNNEVATIAILSLSGDLQMAEEALILLTDSYSTTLNDYIASNSDI